MASIVLRLLLLTLYALSVTRLSVSHDDSSTKTSDDTVSDDSDSQATSERMARIRDDRTRYATIAPAQSQFSACDEPEKEFVADELSLLSAAALIVTNALVVLDLALSRATKPWRFVMRIVYRFGRTNLKLLPLLFLLYLAPQFTALNVLAEAGSGLVRYTVSCQNVRQVALACQYQAKWLSLAFLAYALLVRWMTQRFFARPAAAAADLVASNAYGGASVASSGNHYPNRWSAGMNRWWLLIECIFRPVSLATAHTLADIDLELDETMDLFFERLVFPNLWLTPTIPPDYVLYLPVWRSTDEDSHLPPSYKMKWIASSECAICLDSYRASVDLCGLPCGHHFHQSCIMSWLERDNHHCPICRWPAYRNKHFDSPSYDLNQVPMVAA